MLKYKIIFFDMDGTLIKCKSSWELIHKKFGTTEEAKKALEDYRQGRISYKEFMIRDISSWMRKKERIHIKEIEEILSNFELVDGAKEVARELKRMGLKIVIITAGIDILAEKVGIEVYADKVFSNKLKIDGEGYLVGEGIEVVEPRRKDKIIETVSKEENVPLNETVAVGDTVYDLNMLKKAGLGLYFGDKNEIVDTRIRKIHSLYEIIDYVRG